MTSLVPISPHVKDSSGRRVASAMHSAVFDKDNPIVSTRLNEHAAGENWNWSMTHVGFSYTRTSMEKEDLAFSFVLYEVRCPRLWYLSSAGRGVYGSVTMYQGLDD